jgi:AAHS family 3-hydroxyphenylpropionic acid transporter
MPAGGAGASLITLAVLTGVLPKSFDWRSIYLIGGVAPLLLAPLALAWLPETRPDHSGERRDISGVLFGEGRLGATISLWVAFGGTLIVLYLMTGWLPTLVIGEGLTRIDGDLAALTFNLTGVAGGLAVGRLVDRLGLRRPMIGSYLGLIVSMAALAAVGSFPAIVICAGLAGFFVIGAQFSLYGVSPSYYPPSARALGVGAAVGAGRIGSIIGPSLASGLRAAHASSGQVIAVTLPVILVAGAAAIALSVVGKAHEA